MHPKPERTAPFIVQIVIFTIIAELADAETDRIAPRHPPVTVARGADRSPLL